MKNDHLRPQEWEDFVGQGAIKERLSVHVDAAFNEKRPLPHLFMSGPPGLGKTSLATIIARQLTDPIVSVTMPCKPAVLADTLRDFQGGVLFLDEIHAASRRQQEDLLPLLEDGEMVIGDELFQPPWLTVIGATTEPDKVLTPLYDRFALKVELEPYNDLEMALVVDGLAERLGFLLEGDDADVIARAAVGTPRNARSLLLNLRDLRVRRPSATALDMLAMVGVEPDGMTRLHRRYLEVLDTCKGLAGLDTIGFHLQEKESRLRETERLLLSMGYITYTRGGRRLTRDGQIRVRGGRRTVGRLAGVAS